MILNNKYIYIGILALLYSCSVTKNHQRPETGLPEHFRSASDSAEKDTSILEIRDFFKNKELLTLIDSAVAKNSELLIAVQNIESASSVFRKTKLNYLPELNAQLNAGSNTVSKNSLSGITSEQFTLSRTLQDYSAGLNFSWEIDIWGKIKREKEEAYSVYLQSKEVKKAVQTRIVAEVANAYYNLIMLDEQLKVAQKSKELGEQTVEIMQVQYQVGDVNQLGMQQAKAQLESITQLILRIEQDIVLQENALNRLCGKFSGSIERSGQGENEFAVQSMNYDIALLASRPDVLAAELQLKSANARVGIEQASMYPAITLSAGIGLNSLKASNWFSMPASIFYNFAGGITQPVFNRKRLKLAFEQAKIEREKAVILFRQSVVDAYGEVSDALQKDQKLNQQYESAERGEVLLKEGIESANVLYKNGLINYLEIITAENNYLQSGLTRIQLRRELSGARIELYRAIGGGWK